MSNNDATMWFLSGNFFKSLHWDGPKFSILGVAVPKRACVSGDVPVRTGGPVFLRGFHVFDFRKVSPRIVFPVDGCFRNLIEHELTCSMMSSNILTIAG